MENNCKSPLDCYKNSHLKDASDLEKLMILRTALYDSNYDRDVILDLFKESFIEYLNQCLAVDNNAATFDVRVKSIELFFVERNGDLNGK